MLSRKIHFITNLNTSMNFTTGKSSVNSMISHAYFQEFFESFMCDWIFSSIRSKTKFLSSVWFFSKMQESKGIFQNETSQNMTENMLFTIIVGVTNYNKSSVMHLRPEVNPYPWILEKNPKRGTITERVLRKKIQSAALRRFVYVSVLWIFFPENTLGDGPKKPRIRVNRT